MIQDSDNTPLTPHAIGADSEGVIRDLILSSVRQTVAYFASLSTATARSTPRERDQLFSLAPQLLGTRLSAILHRL